jgi:ATP-dependent exoDNAse (exonuclease V) alpha subunit
MNQNHELLLELWARVKNHIQPKERLEVADILVIVFDEFGMVDDELLDEDLDKEMRAAARSHLSSGIGDDFDLEDRYDDE